MTIRDELDSLRDVVSTGVNNIHQAAALGSQIARTVRHYDGAETSVSTLVSEFISMLERQGFAHVIENHLDYAVRLASDVGRLEYEDMYKLFSLCDEVEDLRSIGLTVDSQRLERLTNALKERFARDTAMARAVAEARSSSDRRTRWWYSLFQD